MVGSRVMLRCLAAAPYKPPPRERVDLGCADAPGACALVGQDLDDRVVTRRGSSGETHVFAPLPLSREAAGVSLPGRWSVGFVSARTGGVERITSEVLLRREGPLWVFLTSGVGGGRGKRGLRNDECALEGVGATWEGRIGALFEPLGCIAFPETPKDRRPALCRVAGGWPGECWYPRVGYLFGIGCPRWLMLGVALRREDGDGLALAGAGA